MVGHEESRSLTARTAFGMTGVWLWLVGRPDALTGGEKQERSGAAVRFGAGGESSRKQVPHFADCVRDDRFWLWLRLGAKTQ